MTLAPPTTAQLSATPSRRLLQDGCDWDTVTADLDCHGHAVTTTPLLDPVACCELRDTFGDDRLFRATVDMARHRFGVGTYHYYGHDLPPIVAACAR
jgi:hypothetical protein